MREKINLAADVISTAATAFTQLKGIFFFPFLIFVMVMSYFAFWFSIAIFIVSVEIEHDEPIPQTSTGCDGKTLQELINSSLGRSDLEHYKYYEWDEEMTVLFISLSSKKILGF